MLSFTQILLCGLFVTSATAESLLNRHLWHKPSPQWLTPPTVVKKAVVVLANSATGVNGTVIFEQASPYTPVKITGAVVGLTPNALRGFHVHASGNLTGGCDAALGHFNPHNVTHGAPTDKTRHVGDLGNIQTDTAGIATLNLTDKIISLFGENTIIGRSVVIHAGTDDLGKGGNATSLTTGNAGSRAACGVIGVA